MKKCNIVKLDKSLEEWLIYESFEEVDFRECFRTIASRCVKCDISADLNFIYTAFGKNFDDIKSAVSYVTEQMLKAMQFVYAWSHMSTAEWLAFSQNFENHVVVDSDETAQKN